MVFVAAFVASVLGFAAAQILFAQDGQQKGRGGKQPPKDSPTKNLPFDPHDISGIWKNPGGFDVALGTDRPPLTDWKQQWSKTRASARNSKASLWIL